MMYGPFVYAGDLARDLGFDGMTPAFWAWCKSQGIEGESGQPCRFDREKIDDVLWSLKTAGAMPNRIGAKGGGNGR